MGTRYTTQSISGFNADPPPDDGTESDSNKAKWGDQVVGKVGTPLKDLAESINTAIVNMVDVAPLAKATAYTTVADDHLRVIECTSSPTIDLGLAVTMGAGYQVTVKSVSGTTTVDPSGSDNIDGAATSRTLVAGNSETYTVNNAGDGYMVSSTKGAGLGANTFTGQQDWSKGTNITAANDITPAGNGNYYTITGSTEIQRIADQNQGAVIRLANSSGGDITIAHNTAAGGGFSSILLAGATDRVFSSSDVITLVQISPTQLFEVGYRDSSLLKIPDTDGTLAADSNNRLSTQKAIKTYVTTTIANVGIIAKTAQSCSGSSEVIDLSTEAAAGTIQCVHFTLDNVSLSQAASLSIGAGTSGSSVSSALAIPGATDPGTKWTGIITFTKVTSGTWVLSGSLNDNDSGATTIALAGPQDIGAIQSVGLNVGAAKTFDSGTIQAHVFITI